MQTFPVSNLKFIQPDWQVSNKVKAVVTTRRGGMSEPPFDGLNLALHVGDDASVVEQNRQLLKQVLGLQKTPCWLDQRHTTDMIYLDKDASQQDSLVMADASWTDVPNVVSVVMTADCLPILITNQQASFVAAIHAGWKGLADGILLKSVQALPDKVENLIAWIGPAISQQAFEVGQDVFEAFVSKDADSEKFFMPVAQKEQKYWQNLPGLAEHQLQQLGLKQVSGGNYCTYLQAHDFYSYRRDGKTGRIASLIWLED